MKKMTFVKFSILFCLTFLFAFQMSAQESKNKDTTKPKEPKKALDAFISSTTKSANKSEPVPGAEITVEQLPGPTNIKSAGGGESGPAEKNQFDVIFKSGAKYYTNDKGEFTINLSSEQFNKLPNEITLKFTIKPKDPKKYNSETNVVTVKVLKPQKPTLIFVVTYIKSDTKTNKGTFAVSSKAQT